MQYGHSTFASLNHRRRVLVPQRAFVVSKDSLNSRRFAMPTNNVFSSVDNSIHVDPLRTTRTVTDS